tara:strand:+ start:2785 stop:3570 length:786 start_codon:yes stop_codon:yes gene_type:complete
MVWADFRPLQRAKAYQDDLDVSQYYVSEKYDGVRAYWDGRNLYTRTGRQIHPPLSWVKGWPSQPLDGELWLGRGHFENISGLVHRSKTHPRDWQKVRFMVFDMPNSEGSFAQRLKAMQQLFVSLSNVSLTLVPQRAIKDKKALQLWLYQLVEQGAEGVMLKRKDSPYRAGYSLDLVKLKLHTDALAQVIGFVPGQGRLKGVMGALIVKDQSGRQFKIGTGFTDRVRQHPPPLGSWVRYKFIGKTQKGNPKFASYLGPSHSK